MTFHIWEMNKKTEMAYSSQGISGYWKNHFAKSFFLLFLVPEIYNIAFRLSHCVIFFFFSGLLESLKTYKMARYNTFNRSNFLRTANSEMGQF